MTLEVKQHRPNVHSVTYDVQPGFEQWVLLRSDAHHDNLLADHKLEKKHLDLALERNATIIEYGDTFCAMQGKWDKRADLSQVRPEHQDGRYLDSLVETAAEFYAPYARLWAVMGPGNHELSILKKHESCLISRLVERMNTMTGSRIYVGGYHGWVRFYFKRSKQRMSRTLYYHHGAGGGGPVTRGVIQTNRRSVYLDGIDVVASGHTHDSWIVPIATVKLNKSCTIERRETLHVRSPGYKDEFTTSAKGFHVERDAPPKPLGAVWLRFGFDYTSQQITIEAQLAS